MAGTVTPESSNERTARLEAFRDEQREVNRLLTPLPAQYAVLEERLSGLRGDLNDGLDAIRREIGAGQDRTDRQFEKIQAESTESKRARRAVYTGFALATVGLLGNLALQIAGLGGGHP